MEEKCVQYGEFKQWITRKREEDPKEAHRKVDNNMREAEHGDTSPHYRQPLYLADNKRIYQYSSHRARNRSGTLMPSRTMGYGTRTTASLIEKLTSTEDDEYEEDTTVENHENNETRAERIIVPSSHEAIGVDKQKNGTTDIVMDPTIPEREVLYEFQDDIIFKDQIVTRREDNIERERDHDTDHEQQRFEGFINTEDIFIHLVYLVTKTD